MTLLFAMLLSSAECDPEAKIGQDGCGEEQRCAIIVAEDDDFSMPLGPECVPLSCLPDSDPEWDGSVTLDISKWMECREDSK